MLIQAIFGNPSFEKFQHSRGRIVQLKTESAQLIEENEELNHTKICCGQVEGKYKVLNANHEEIQVQYQEMRMQCQKMAVQYQYVLTKLSKIFALLHM